MVSWAMEGEGARVCVSESVRITTHAAGAPTRFRDHSISRKERKRDAKVGGQGGREEDARVQ